MSELSAKLLDLAGFVADLPISSERRAQDVLSEPGQGSIVIQNDDPAYSSFALDGDDLVQFLVDASPAWTMIVEKMRRVAVDPSDDDSKLITTFTGRGHLALLERAPVYPSNGIARRPIQEDRTFNWTSIDFVEGPDWEPAIAIKTTGDAKVPASEGVSVRAFPGDLAIGDSGPDVEAVRYVCYLSGHDPGVNDSGMVDFYGPNLAFGPYGTGTYATCNECGGIEGFQASAGLPVTGDVDSATWAALFAPTAGQPSGWPIYPWDPSYPDNEADVLWASGSTDTLAPDGQVYFRQTINISSGEGLYKIYLAADDRAQLFVDGIPIVSCTGYTHASDGDVVLSDGDHLVAVVAENVPNVVPINPAGVAWSIFATDGAGHATLQVGHSVAGISCLPYPADTPGMTPGRVMRLVLDEAQARGELLYVTLGFSDDVDSDGVDWPSVSDIATKVGTDLLTFFREIAGTYVDLWMDPAGFRLDAWNIGGRGTSPGVVFNVATDVDDPTSGNITALGHEVDLVHTNAALVRWNGGWAEETAVVGERRNHLLGLGALSSRSEVTRVSQAQLAEFGRTREAVTVGILPQSSDETPYVPGGFLVGDMVTVPTLIGAGETRCLSITLSEDRATGRAIFSPTFGDLILDPAAAVTQATKKMINGTFRGASKVAQPVVPQFTPITVTQGGPMFAGATPDEPEPMACEPVIQTFYSYNGDLTDGPNYSYATDLDPTSLTYALGSFVQVCGVPTEEVQIMVGYPATFDFGRSLEWALINVGLLVDPLGAGVLVYANTSNDASTGGVARSSISATITQPDADVWHHLGVSISTSGTTATFKLYWDGVEVASTTFATGDGLHPSWSGSGTRSWITKTALGVEGPPRPHPIMSLYTGRSSIFQPTYYRTSIPNFATVYAALDFDLGDDDDRALVIPGDTLMFPAFDSRVILA